MIQNNQNSEYNPYLPSTFFSTNSFCTYTAQHVIFYKEKEANKIQ